MFWGLRVREEIQKRFQREIEAGMPLIIRDEKTMSGRVHMGSLRGVVIHGVVSELLTDSGIANRYLFEINDFDVMDGLPVYLDQEQFRPYMGQLLCNVPAPDSSAPNYAEYWANEFRAVIERVGFYPEYYRSSELYRSGRYNEVIRIALDNADRIREIYKEVSGSIKDSDWLPIQVVCEQCSKVGTTKATSWDGRMVNYNCLADQVSWAQGCGHAGVADPFDGRAKLPWKVEWAAKFKVLGVHIEGGGKDHSTKGGARDIARHIVREVFQYPEPYDIPYNFFVIEGKKMSSSKGQGSSAKDIADLLPPHLLRFLMMREPKRDIDFAPYGDTIPILYDMYDAATADFHGPKATDWAPVYEFTQLPAKRKTMKNVFRPRFSQLAYLTQMPHVSVEDKVSGMKGSSLSEDDKQELAERVSYATHWLEGYSPEKYKFQIQEETPAAVHDFSPLQRKGLAMILRYMQEHPLLNGEELHTYLHEIKNELQLKPQELFSSIYLSLLGKDSGPQAGWFLSALDRDFVIRRLTAVISDI